MSLHHPPEGPPLRQDFPGDMYARKMTAYNRYLPLPGDTWPSYIQWSGRWTMGPDRAHSHVMIGMT